MIRPYGPRISRSSPLSGALEMSMLLSLPSFPRHPGVSMEVPVRRLRLQTMLTYLRNTETDTRNTETTCKNYSF